MAEYGKVETGFWKWANRNNISDEGRLLALYLITSPHRNSIGVYYLPIGYVSADLGWEKETILKGFGELFRKRFAMLCKATDFVIIRDYIHHNEPTNPNVATNMKKLIEEIPREFSYWIDFIEQLKPFGKWFGEPFRKQLETLSKPYTFETNTEQNNTEQKEKKLKEKKESTDADFEKWYSGYPHKVGRGAAEKAFPKALNLAGSVDVLTESVKAYIRTKPPDRNWCNPATWLNEKRWLDGQSGSAPDDDDPTEKISKKLNIAPFGVGG